MLVQFEVNNFCSIKDTVTFSLKSEKKDSHSFPIRKFDLLQSVVIYGANASGKSNLLKAMRMMASLVLNKKKVISVTDALEHQPFLLNSETETASTSFEIVFIIDEIIYRYGFEYDNKMIYAEWLFSDEKGTEAKLFYRDVDDEFYVNPTKFIEGKGLAKKTLKNHLFLWKCASDNGEISQKIQQWFFNFNMIDGLNDRGYRGFSTHKLDDTIFKKDILELVKIADLGISDIDTQEKDLFLNDEFASLPNDFQKLILNKEISRITDTMTVHKKFDKDNNFLGNVEFNLKEHESRGTKKLFAISAPILDTLKNGKILVIDELDASLHPILTQHLIEMFHNKELNQKNAQLIFATHDTNLLQNHLLCRDQIWFSEKDRYGATDIYSLLEYKENKTRKDTNKEKYYLQGRYGAIPYIGEFHFEDIENES
jgi:AAA15 family ATPase/GTPase